MSKPQFNPPLPSLAIALVLICAGCAAPSTVVLFPGVEINHNPAGLQLDTGSDTTLLTPAGAKTLGVKPGVVISNSTVNGFVSDISLSEPVPIGEFTNEFSAQISVDKLSWLLRLYFKAEDIDGIVGWPEVRDNILVFNPDRHMISGRSELPPDVTNWTRLRLGDSDVLTLEITNADGTFGDILVDTGNPMGVGLPMEQWQKWRADHPKAPAAKRQFMSPGIGTMVSHEAWADELQLGGLSLTDVPVAEVPPEFSSQIQNFAGSMGMYALSRVDMVIDGGDHAVYIRPRPPPGPPYPGIKRTGPVATGEKPNINWIVADTVKLDPASFLVMAANLKVVGGDFAGAAADCNRATELDPASVDALVVRASAKDGSDDLPGALSDLNHAMDLDASNMDTRLARAQLLEEQGKTADALTDLQIVLGHEPRNAAALSARAEAHQLQGDFTAASADFRAAMNFDILNSNYFCLCSHLADMRGGSPAAGFAKTVSGWKSDWVKTLGRFLVGDLTESALLSAASKPDRSQPATDRQCSACYFIGMTRLIKGDRSGARQFFQKAVATHALGCDSFSSARAELSLYSRNRR